ncbi:MAG: hydroxymethylglutaryl-CoA lyase [Rhodospirillales bacterium]|nr:hydroxymethylglutaryl-CoA lyase [Rhodospirillales bacterium]
MGEHVTVCEVGPRDGLQMAKGIMPTAIKSRWIAAIAAAGVPEIEVGSFVPAKLIPQMADTAEIVREAVKLPGVRIVALAPNLRGAQDAYANGAHRISVPVSVSEGHSRANLNRTPGEQVAEVARLVAWVRAQARPMEVEGACSTAFGCSIDGVVPEGAVVRVAEGLAAAGVDSIALADTVGYAHPAQIKATVRAVRAAVGRRFDGLHLHDTMGLGLANALAGLEEGIRSFDAALAGLGGCPFAPGASGNIVTEDLVFMLHSMGFTTGIDLEKLIAARAVLREGLPHEPMHGNVSKAGLPPTYRVAA